MPDLSQDVFEIQNPLPTTTTTATSLTRMSSLTTAGLNGSASQTTTLANGKNVNGGSAGGQASSTTPVTLSVPGQQELAQHNGSQSEAPYHGYKRDLDHR